MSDAPVTAPTAIGQIDEAVRLITEAKRITENAKLGLPFGGFVHQTLEMIDDKLHDALAALGQ